MVLEKLPKCLIPTLGWGKTGTKAMFWDGSSLKGEAPEKVSVIERPRPEPGLPGRDFLPGLHVSGPILSIDGILQSKDNDLSIEMPLK